MSSHSRPENYNSQTIERLFSIGDSDGGSRGRNSGHNASADLSYSCGDTRIYRSVYFRDSHSYCSPAAIVAHRKLIEQHLTGARFKSQFMQFA